MFSLMFSNMGYDFPQVYKVSLEHTQSVLSPLCGKFSAMTMYESPSCMSSS